MKKRVIKKETYIIFLAVAAALALLFLFTDLNISKAVFNRTNVFGRIFEVIGEYPNSLVLVLGAPVLFGALYEKEKLLSIQNLVLFLISGIGWGGLTLFSWDHYQLKDVDTSFKVLAICGTISIIGDIALLYLSTKIDKKVLKKFVGVAVFAILLALFQLAAVNVIKVVWGRMRFRDMAPPYNEFTKWIIPNFFSGNKSFPSGHTANATTILVLFHLVQVIDKNKKGLKIVLQILAVSWPTLTAISRVIVGAHFASDVLFGIIVNVTVFFIIENWVFSEREKGENFLQKTFRVE